MTTQLLETTEQADEVTGECRPEVAPRVEGVRFDRATRRRLIVASDVAATLEGLAESRAWDRLDEALAAHLLAQAGRLRSHVRSLQSQRAVKGVEDAALRLKRLERRLEIAAGELAPACDKDRGAAALFLGDFTEAEATPAEQPTTKAKRAPARKGAREKAAALGDGARKLMTRAEKAAAKASSRRITAYVTVGVLVTAAALAWNFKESYVQARQVSRPPSVALKMNDFLDELKVFVPAESTVLRDRDMRVVVSREWLLRSESQRRVDAEGAHVWLSNRNVRSLLLTWDDGTPLVRLTEGQATWYDMSAPGVPLAAPPVP